MTDVRDDRAFAEGMERAAQRLFSAAHAARTQGVSHDDVLRIVMAGMEAAEKLSGVAYAEARAAEIGYVPDGVPADEREPQLRVVRDNEDRVAGGRQPFSIHPMFDERRVA